MSMSIWLWITVICFLTSLLAEYQAAGKINLVTLSIITALSLIPFINMVMTVIAIHTTVTYWSKRE